MTGRVASLQRSGGGVPKLPVDRAEVRVSGMDGDLQRDRKHHGGPERALCLYSQELIDALAAEGHPITVGAVGENVTIAALDWRRVRPGARIRLGTVEVEVTHFAAPCRTIRGAFLVEEFTRISEKVHPGWSRVYARVLREGTIAAGDPVAITKAG
jgi:MOSC domain-containing protein YiiM